MNKLLIAVAAAFLAATTLFAPTAEAGIKVPIGATSSQSSTVHKAGFRFRPRLQLRFHLARRIAKRRAAAKRRARARAVARAKARARARSIARAKAKAKARAIAAAKAKAKALAAAKAAAAEEAEVAEATEDENSTISTSNQVAEIESDDMEEVAAVSDELSCKKFVPEVGMTITVPCE